MDGPNFTAVGAGQHHPRAVSVAGIIADKVYDATTPAVLSPSRPYFVGLHRGDDVTLVATNATATFAAKDAGKNVPVTLTGVSLAGRRPLTMCCHRPPPAISIRAPLTVAGIAVADKTYDGSASAPVDISKAALGGIIGNDVVALNAAGAIATFTNADVGSNIPRISRA